MKRLLVRSQHEFLQERELGFMDGVEKPQVDSGVRIPRLPEEDGCEERRRSQKTCRLRLESLSKPRGQILQLAGIPQYSELRNGPPSRSNTRGWEAWNCQCEREPLGRR